MWLARIIVIAIPVSFGTISSIWTTKTAVAQTSVVTAAKTAGDKQFSGVASFYSKGMKGSTASGVKYDETQLTAAHKTLPFGTRLIVTNTATNRSVTVVVNDRGPFSKGRVIDLSYAAAVALGLKGGGLIRVIAVIE